MDYVRFLTFCDDEVDYVLPLERLKKYNIMLCPYSYSYDGKLYHTRVNTDIGTYSEIIHKNKDTPKISAPADFIKYIYECTSKMGCLSLYVICPHSRYSDCYSTALLARRNFYRTHASSDEIEINVIDSKTLGIGTMLFTLKVALDYFYYYGDSDLTEQLARKSAKNAKTFILTYNTVPFSAEPKTLRAYLLSGSKLNELNISESTEEVKYNHFSEIVCKAIKNSGGKYSVSFGAECGFEGNVLGRIKIISNVAPVAVAKYGILMTSILGTEALCVHII